MTKSVVVSIIFAATWIVGSKFIVPLTAEHFGAGLIERGEGKIHDSNLFLDQIFNEFCHLILASVLLTLGSRWLYRKCISDSENWLTGLVGLGVLAIIYFWLVFSTLLVWLCFWEGARTHNVTRFQIKALMPVQAGLRGAIVGSSQARASFEEGEMNARLKSRSAHITELHYPGCSPFDLHCVFPYLERNLEAKFVVTYLTPLDLFAGVRSSTLSVLPRVEWTGELYEAADGDRSMQRDVLWAGLRSLLPIYQNQEVIYQRIVGAQVTQVGQRNWDKKLESRLDRRAALMVNKFQLSPSAELNQMYFQSFVGKCLASGMKVFVCEGRVNPVLSDLFDEDYVGRTRRFLEHLSHQNPDVCMLFTEDLIQPDRDDFTDLTHVNPSFQRVYSSEVTSIVMRELQPQ